MKPIAVSLSGVEIYRRLPKDIFQSIAYGLVLVGMM